MGYDMTTYESNCVEWDDKNCEMWNNYGCD